MNVQLAVMTAKNFYTFNILIEFESICAFSQVLVEAKEFHFRGLVTVPGETDGHTKPMWAEPHTKPMWLPVEGDGHTKPMWLDPVQP